MDKESRDYREHEYPELLASLPSHQAEPLAAYVEAVCEERDRNHREYREQAALVSLWEKRATDGVKAREAVEAERDRLKRLIEESPKIWLGNFIEGDFAWASRASENPWPESIPFVPGTTRCFAVPMAALEGKEAEQGDKDEEGFAGE